MNAIFHGVPDFLYSHIVQRDTELSEIDFIRILIPFIRGPPSGSIFKGPTSYYHHLPCLDVNIQILGGRTFRFYHGKSDSSAET